MTHTITAAELAQLREALFNVTSKLESQQFRNPVVIPPVYKDIIAAGFDALSLLSEIAARTQEPVAWMGEYNINDIRDHYTVVMRHKTDFDKTPDRVRPLYDAPQPVAVPEWQPIETAPKDGTPILLCKKSRCGDGFFTQGSYEGKGSWVWPYIKIDPTHWMPLPAAPKEATK